MRRSRGVIALLETIFLGFVLIAAAQGGPGPDLGKRWTSAAPLVGSQVVTPLLGKRWS